MGSVSETIKIDIESVRCVERCSLNLRPGSCTVLGGKNNTGKSSLLEIVAQALWAFPSSEADSHAARCGFSTTFYRQTPAGCARPSVTVVLDTKRHLSRPGPIAARDGWLTIYLLASLHQSTIVPSSPSSARFVPRRLSFDAEGFKVELLETRADRLQTVHDLAGESYDMPVSLRSDPSWQITSASLGRVGVALPGLYSLQSPVGRALCAFANSVFYLSAARNPSFTSAPNESALNQADLYSVTPVLKRMRLTADADWQNLSLALSMIFDQAQELVMREVSGSAAAHVRLRAGDLVPVSDMGYGLRNALHILTVMTAAPLGAVILIDEPEQGMNQSLQRDFAAVLEDLRPDAALVVATQSEGFCRGLSRANVLVAETEGNSSSVSRIQIGERDDLRRLAQALGINPLYLMEGGRILYVDGKSDKPILEDWLSLHFGQIPPLLEVQPLGGSGKIGEEFAKPMFVSFQEGIFFLLDSDGDSEDRPLGADMERRVQWFGARGLKNYYVLKRREIENYIGYERIAEAAGVHPSKIRPPERTEKWWDIKAAVQRVLGFYDEMKFTVAGYRLLTETQRKQLFADETEEILKALKTLLH